MGYILWRSWGHYVHKKSTCTLCYSQSFISYLIFRIRIRPFTNTVQSIEVVVILIAWIHLYFFLERKQDACLDGQSSKKSLVRLHDLKAITYYFNFLQDNYYTYSLDISMMPLLQKESPALVAFQDSHIWIWEVRCFNNTLLVWQQRWERNMKNAEVQKEKGGGGGDNLTKIIQLRGGKQGGTDYSKWDRKKY